VVAPHAAGSTLARNLAAKSQPDMLASLGTLIFVKRIALLLSHADVIRAVVENLKSLLEPTD